MCACWRMALPCACDLAAVASNTACLCLLLCSPRALLWLHDMLVLQCFPVATPFPSTGQPSAQGIERGLTALYVRYHCKHMILLLSSFAYHMVVQSIKQFRRSPVGLLAEAAAAGSAAAADA